MTRIACLTAAGVIIAAGLLLRLPRWPLPLAIHHYGGGILWGAMLLFLMSALRPRRWGLRGCMIAAGSLAGLIELSRLIHGPALDSFRHALAGELLLGRIFSVWTCSPMQSASLLPVCPSGPVFVKAAGP